MWATADMMIRLIRATASSVRVTWRRLDSVEIPAPPTGVADSVPEAFDDVVASGIYTMALWRKLDHELARDIRWICGVAWEDVRWPHPLRPGDVVRARSTFLDKRPSRSDPGRGVVTCLYELVREDGTVLWSCRGISLVERRAQGSPPD